MAIRNVTLDRQIDVPEGATHYMGDIVGDCLFFKRTVNETKTFDGWSIWKNNDWYLDYWYPELPEHWSVRPIPFADSPKAG